MRVKNISRVSWSEWICGYFLYSQWIIWVSLGQLSSSGESGPISLSDKWRGHLTAQRTNFLCVPCFMLCVCRSFLQLGFGARNRTKYFLKNSELLDTFIWKQVLLALSEIKNIGVICSILYLYSHCCNLSVLHCTWNFRKSSWLFCSKHVLWEFKDYPWLLGITWKL